MTPLLFGPWLFGPPELFGRSQNVGEIGQNSAGAEC